MRKPVLFGCLGLGGIILVVAVILGVIAVSRYNGLVKLDQGVNASWAQVQNVYQRRADLIPNLVNTVKGAADFEKTTITDVIKARQQVNEIKLDPNSAPTDPAQLAQFQQAQAAVGSALSRLLVTVERYPELKANQNFLNLQTQLEGTENRITVERGRFNETVQAYNSAVKTFPTVLIAGLMGFSPKPYFQATAGSDRPPEVGFDFGATPAS